MKKVFVAVFGFVLSTLPVYAQGVPDINNITTQDEQQLKSSFYDTFKNVCMSGIKQHIKQNDKATNDRIVQICDCYSSTMSDKVDWAKLKSMTTQEQMASYLKSLDPAVRAECKTKLDQQPVQNTFQKTGQQPGQNPYRKKHKSTYNNPDKQVGIHHGSFIDVSLSSIVILGIMWLLAWVLRKIFNK